MTQKLKVLIVALHLEDMKVARHVTDLVNGLWAQGHAVWVWCPLPGEATRQLKRSDAGVFEDLQAIPDLGFQVIHAVHAGAAIVARERYPDIPMVFYALGLSQDALPPSIDVNLHRVVADGDDIRLEEALVPLYREAIAEFRGLGLEEVPASRELRVLIEELRSRMNNAEREARHVIADLERRIHELSSVQGGSTSALRRMVARMAPWGTRRRSFMLMPLRAARMVRSQGLRAALAHLTKVWVWLPRMFERQLPPDDPSARDARYGVWERRQHLPRRRLRELAREAAALQSRPTISLLMPTYDPEPAFLKAAIRSVRAQIYPEWELIIADDGSSRSEVLSILRKVQEDARIHVTFLPENRGISAASNAALDLASGGFVGLLDHDDELKPDALLEVAKLLNEQPDLDYIYSDEDKRSEDGQLVEPFFKPGWSPDLLLSVNYVTHLSVYRRSVLQEIGGFREGFEGSQDHDLVLRVTETTDRIAHIPLPLYSWRRTPGSTAAGLEHKDYAWDAGKRAIEEALQRRGRPGRVEPSLTPGRYRVRYDTSGEGKVTVIIPTRDRVDLLRRCLESVRARTSYPNYEILIMDNDSRERETRSYLAAFAGRVEAFPGAFNYARMMNVAAAASRDADHLLFLNNDTEVINDEWMTAMVEHSQRPEVAAVGARLLFPDGRPQHEGIVLGYCGAVAGNVDHGGYFDLGQTIRNCSAVTGACMMIRGAVFRELGGFDERLAVAYNDVDLCLRAREKGYLVVYTPYALLYHAESSSRRDHHPMEDERYFRERWGEPGEYRDPYYNPNLDPNHPFLPRLPE